VKKSFATLSLIATIAKFLELGLVADGLPVARNDEGIVSRRGEIGVARRDRSVDASAG
jgi:hypothetical protein